MALKGNVRIISNLNDYWQKLYVYVCETPQWLQEYPLDPIPPIDMRTICVGKVGISNAPRSAYFADEEIIVSIYVEVDKYFENET